ncbi:P37 [Firespike leaf roll-associated virus]|nr:P37 [Firespike leaf roll-associated virus]
MRCAWDSEMHGRFFDAVMKTGGVASAKPRTILQELGNDPAITAAHLKSYLQIFRQVVIFNDDKEVVEKDVLRDLTTYRKVRKLAYKESVLGRSSFYLHRKTVSEGDGGQRSVKQYESNFSRLIRASQEECSWDFNVSLLTRTIFSLACSDKLIYFSKYFNVNFKEKKFEFKNENGSRMLIYVNVPVWFRVNDIFSHSDLWITAFEGEFYKVQSRDFDVRLVDFLMDDPRKGKTGRENCRYYVKSLERFCNDNEGFRWVSEFLKEKISLDKFPDKPLLTVDEVTNVIGRRSFVCFDCVLLIRNSCESCDFDFNMLVG